MLSARHPAVKTDSTTACLAAAICELASLLESHRHSAANVALSAILTKELFSAVAKGSEGLCTFGGNRMVGPPSENGFASAAMKRQIGQHFCQTQLPLGSLLPSPSR
jgi:hypothetical protein